MLGNGKQVEYKYFGMKSLIGMMMLFVCLLSLVSTNAENEDDEILIQIPGETVVCDTSSLSDHDGLAEEFISRMMPTRRRNRLMAARPSRGSLLTGLEAEVYAKLKENIEAIAMGNRQSTEMTYDFSEFPDYITQFEYTAEELGIPAIVENGAISQTAMNAITEKLALKSDEIIDALVADCPYDFYWYDKTENHGVMFGYPTSFNASNDGSGWKINFSGSYHFSFYVAEYYQLDGQPYEYNISFGQNAQAAAENASAIVAQYETSSDPEKIRGYASEICRLTSYNEAALDPNTPYGNPWQLIWVFDDDPDTKVVCEGYSKAFQYLCNLTAFSSDIGVITVSGQMIGGTGAGEHMWNLVSMEDGRNYLVDVTNIDEGTIGSPDHLLLACASEYFEDNGYGIVIPEKGEIVYYYDSGTLSLYSAEELNLSNAPYGHVHNFDQIGIDEVNRQVCKLCSECGYQEPLAEDEIQKLPENLTILDSEALAGTALTVVEIPASVTVIAPDAFDNSAVEVIIGHNDVARDYASAHEEILYLDLE